MRKFLMELIGTFFLVSVIGFSVLEPGAGAFAPFAIGFILMAMIYAGYPVSGAHYNPAVTVAVYIRGKCAHSDIPIYIAAQLIGSVSAALTVKSLAAGLIASPMALNLSQALAAEIIFTFALVFVVLNVATVKQTEGNSYYGLAIALTVIASVFAVGKISGSVLNPAVAVGVTLMGVSSLQHIWIYFFGNFCGGVLAAVVFKWLHPEEFVNMEKSG
ncbi:MAG: aquaporin [Candidatus Omnitrophica bacterium]|nr:aquaporin [Candidatus Omnitrophota bacterium]